MAKGFKKKNSKGGHDFIPTEKNVIRDSTPDTEINIEVNNDSEEFSEGIRRDFEEPEIKQVLKYASKEDEINGIPKQIDHEVSARGYTIEIPEGEDDWDIVDDFMKINNLYDIVKVDTSKRERFDSEFSFRLEKGFKDAGMLSEYPGGSIYLSTDGEWFGGEQINGYDEDHRPQIRKALTFAGLKLDGEGDENGKLSASQIMIEACEKSGIMRGRVGRDQLNIDIFQPLTNSQIRALKDQVIENHLKPNDINIDLNDQKGLTEDKILRLIGANEDYEEDYSE